MIPRSRGVAMIAVALAAATHSLALHDFSGPEATQIEGSGTVEVAALGSSFKDFVAGNNAPAPARTRQHAVSPTLTQPKASAAHSVPGNTHAATAVIDGFTVQKPHDPQNPAPVSPQVAATSPADASEAVRPEVERKTPDQTASQKGNSAKTEKKGNASGKKRKGAAQAEKSKQSRSGSGNAEASNYAGLVKRKITRARRKSANIRGSALVAFRIADNGGLFTAGITRSSGSKRLDRIALEQVRAAAPFPPPPAAARRDYTIEIVGQ